MPRSPYDFAAIEAKWQRYWLENKTFKTFSPGEEGFDASRPKYYVLDMFPYPSGAGLHVGHPEGYTATDIVARYKRMRGFNVLHPMGWDSFGLPAEQHAVKTGTHPAITTQRNINTFRTQIRSLGFSYDWDRELATSDPDYYRWTQWIFLQLFKKGLAYQAESPVWWCQQLGTVLANEEVDSEGRSEVGGFPCVRKPLRQWMLRITAYAERLLQGLDRVDWPESIKKMQRDWIGRSEGADVDFVVAGGPQAGQKILIYTTRPDTLFGATYMVLAPEHPLVEAVSTPEHLAEVRAYRETAARKSELDRTALTKEKTGVFTGGYAINPVNDQKIPIWIADYVLLSYGTGAIMAVPAHDERDFDFAIRFNLPIVEVVRPPFIPDSEAERRRIGLVREVERDGNIVRCFTGDGIAINSPIFNNQPTAQAKETITRWLEEQGKGEKAIRYKLRDWLFSRQRYWGEPFPIICWDDGTVEPLDENDLPLTLPEIEDFSPTGEMKPPLSKAESWCRVTDPNTGRTGMRETNVMPQWAGSCWYYLRFIDPKNNRRFVDPAKEKYWMPVDLYIGGAEHAVLHLLYSRFWHSVLYDIGAVSTPEPFMKLFNQGMITAPAYRTSTGITVPTADVVWVDDKPTHPRTGEILQVINAKMSKSLGNVVNPEEVIAEWGADSMRLYEMYMGPLDAGKIWDTRAIVGVNRFLQRSWRLVVGDEKDEGDCLVRPSLDENRAPDMAIERILRQTIKKVTLDIESLAFNTAIAQLMTFVNEATKNADALTRSQAERFVLVLSPFAPHSAEELWERLGHTQSLAYASWPTYDEALCATDTIEIPVQINGKIRERLYVSPDISQEALLALAKEAAASRLEGKQIVKEIVVPGRLVNLVVKG
ncbi:MAG TPA: leucine--tRNA ligase [bacterium]|nr:leucine--tRNA ligase [bacterium]HQL61081.1 leucine--tRNA ligase [bacterium]